MSHQPERKEKDCLNCGAIIQGRYCYACGQENIAPKQSFGALIKHFIFDIFHFDGKFFETLKYLLFRPGKVPAEYMAGKRMHYLDPIRMYLFTSAIFFLAFFSIKDVSKAITSQSSSMTRAERFSESVHTSARLKKDSVNNGLKYKLDLLLDTTQTLKLLPVKNKYTSNDSFLVIMNTDSFLLQPSFISPEKATFKGNSWLAKQIERSYKEKINFYGDDERKMLANLSNDFTHRLPYLLFLSLPIFALILKLLYFRRKNFLYSDHIVFTLYHYIFSFILMFLFFVTDEIHDAVPWAIFTWFNVAVIIAWAVYLFAGMKNFYRQGWLKTFFKFLILNVSGIITLLVLFLIFLFLSFIF